MKFVITGGGTGGHIYPALAIADGLKEEYPGADILYIGTKTGLEADVVPKAGYPIQFIQSQGLSRKISFDNLKATFKTVVGLGQALQILRQFKPDLVVGTGGFVSGPVMLAAVLLKRPTLIHEQNAFPGLTNRLISKRVDQIAISFQESEKYFPQRGLVHTGNPIRKEILTRSRKDGYRDLQLDPKRRTLFVFGGSGGAKSINEAMLDLYSFIGKNPGYQLLHVTGKRDYATQIEKVKERGLSLSNRIRIEEYLYQIEDAYAVADLIIGRAGAISIAEMTARGIPAILIPFPFATDNHQEYNARALEKVGAAKVLLDRELSGGRLVDLIQEIFSHRENVERMKEASLKMGRPDADQRIIQTIQDILKE